MFKQEVTLCSLTHLPTAVCHGGSYGTLTESHSGLLPSRFLTYKEENTGEDKKQILQEN